MRHRARTGAVFVVGILALVVIGVSLTYLALPALVRDGILPPPSATRGQRVQSTSNTSGPKVSDPDISGDDKSTITYPSLYPELADFALARINDDRMKFNLTTVAPSPVPSGQQHADSMLYFGYFSHWDTQGFKPYVRYSLLNGTGAMEENVAFESNRFPTFTNLVSVENAIARLEYQMMYNDSACCENGHRANILDPLHNRVSLGIEFNSTCVFLVEDLENDYLDLARPTITDGDVVSLAGNTTASPSSLTLRNVQVVVYYDGYPGNLTSQQLDSMPYSGAYSLGNFTGGVVPTCSLSCERYPAGITVQALAWRVSPNSLQIAFQLTEYLRSYGKGAYTVYVEQDVHGVTEMLASFCFLDGVAY